MKLRLSNGYSFAVEFHAANQQEFVKSIRRAAMEFFAHEGRSVAAQLHVATDSGEWLSANYPRSNAHYLIRFGQVDRADWGDAVTSNGSGTWFEYAISGLANDLST